MKIKITNKNISLFFTLSFFVFFSCSWQTKDKLLLGAFAAGQFLSAGNMNYQQEHDCYEVNPIYGKHPDKQTIYNIKIMETFLLFSLTEFFPKYRTEVLLLSNMVVFGFIYYDNKQGIDFKFNF